MNKEAIASNLIVSSVLRYIKDHQVHFGLIARNLPPFDIVALYHGFEELLFKQAIYLALVGFEGLNNNDYGKVATTIERAVEWRNNPDINSPIVVILNPKRSQEKTHSLELFETFSDSDLRQYICMQSAEKSSDQEKAIWKVLKSASVARFLPLVAAQIVDYYVALQDGIAPGDALPCIRLLCDREIINYANSRSELTERLKDNCRQLQRLLSLNKQDYRALARAFESDKVDQHRRTFLHIQAYTQNPTQQNLEKLSYNEVKSLFDAPTIQPPLKTKSASKGDSKRPYQTPDQFVVEQLLNSNPDELQDLEESIEQIIEVFREDPYSNQDFSEKVQDETTIRMFHHNQELPFSLPLDKDSKHPLEESMRIWVQAEHWGGLVYVKPEIDPATPLPKIIDDSVVDFKPLQPLKDTDNEKKHGNLLALFRLLDRAVESIDKQGEGLEELLQKLDKQRIELVAYRTLFLYVPVMATTVKVELFKMVDNYVKIYDQLADRLQNIYRQAEEQFHDTVEQAAVQFLALDVVVIDRLGKEAALLTTLHPLHLWKWLELAQRLKNNAEDFNEAEQAKIVEAVKSIPTLLNTLLLDDKLFQPSRHLDEPRLVFAGEIRNPSSEVTVGIPFYEPIARQKTTTDGLDKLEDLIRNFLALYPPARLGLVITLIDPPALQPILEALASLHTIDNMPVLDGARVIVYCTNPQAPIYDIRTIAEEEVFALFRQNPHWSLRIDLIQNGYEQICSRVKEQPSHITLLCDPSTAVVQPAIRTSQEQPNPFVIPLQVNYDPLSDTVRFVQSPTNGVFDAYMKVRNNLTGEINKRTFGVGNKPGIKDQHLEMLAEASRWLIIIDRLYGTVELPPLGQRIAWFTTGSRMLSVYTQDQQRWREHLEDHLQSLSIKANWQILEQHLPDILTVFPDGLLSTVDDVPEQKSKATHQALRQNSVEKLLSLVTTLYWYRQDNQATVLVHISSASFHDWFGDEKLSHQKTVDYFMALWYQQDSLLCDIIAVRTASDRQPSLPEEQPYFLSLQHFAQTLESLFTSQADQSLLAPMRRETLRETLSKAVFTPFPNDMSPNLQGEGIKTKAEWTKIINNLFSDYRPSIRLRIIRVALQDMEKIPCETLPLKIYQEEILTLPASLLQTALKTKTFTQPNTPISENISSITRQKKEKTYLPSDELLTAPINQEQDIIYQASDADEIRNADASQLQVANAMPSEKVKQQAERLRKALIDYGIAVAGVDMERTQIGPRIVRYWVKLQPPAGRLAEVQKYAVDLARELSSKSVPIIDNIPGEPYIGIDLAQENPQNVPFAPALDELPNTQPDKLLVAVGVNPAGIKVQCDLVKLPHMLVAGSTGSGKTMFLSTLIASLVRRHSSKDLELLLVDPKQTDFVIFGQIPHLRAGRIFYDPLDAIVELKTLTEAERNRRTDLLQKARCPNILEYNRRNPEKRLSWIVIVVDELADIMLTLSRNERDAFERQIGRLTATGRSIGIHLILATQRPTTDVITGTIKANIPARVSFRLPSVVDSRTILDYTGAEHLLGQGDMLAFLDGEMQRLQGYYAPYAVLDQLLD